MGKTKAIPIQKPFKIKPIKVKRFSVKIPKMPKMSAKRMKI